MNGSGGDNRVYGLGNDGRAYNIGRNTFRYPNTWKADLRLAKRFDIGERRQLELIAETFNLFIIKTSPASNDRLLHREQRLFRHTPHALLPHHQYRRQRELRTTTLTGSGTPIAAFGRPLNINATDFYRERQIEIGVRMRF